MDELKLLRVLERIASALESAPLPEIHTELKAIREELQKFAHAWETYK